MSGPDVDQRAVAYAEDLAFIHDAGFGHIARGAARTLIDQLQFERRTGGLVVELACGSGISSELLVNAGYEVLGYDLSPEMIELATRRVPDASFQAQSLYDAAIPRCLAVTAIGEAFNYLFDPRAGFGAMVEVFARVYAALEPHGILLFDVAQPGRALPRMEHNRFDGEGWWVTSEAVEIPGARRMERRIVSTRRMPAGGERRSEELHELALYDHEEVHAALVETGFVPRSLASYSGEYLFTLGHGGFVAVKPGRPAP
ncbi:MAG TPA: methyltransferase domain-containing protein [Solirubrobacterales bacterium]|nr:methyltransferase domain-containing protein [Solirubrobacterales bacterium]